MTTGAEALRHIQQYRQTVGAGLKLGIEHEVGVALYEFILEQRIKTVVETGIAHGFSSWYFLEALSQTGGRLYSIEPHVREVLVVPGKYQHLWQVNKAVSPAGLISLLKKLGQVDLFWHDSDHTYAGQFGEYAVASHHARFIGSHDINRTGAYIAFKDLYGWRDRLAGTGKWGVLEKAVS